MMNLYVAPRPAINPPERHWRTVIWHLSCRLHGTGWGDRVEAEDIAQETLLRFAKKALTWEPDGAKVRTWLYRVAGNLITDRQRARTAFSNRRYRRYLYHRYSAASRRETRCPPCGTQGTDRPPGPPAGRLNPCLLSAVYQRRRLKCWPSVNMRQNRCWRVSGNRCGSPVNRTEKT